MLFMNVGGLAKNWHLKNVKLKCRTKDKQSYQCGIAFLRQFFTKSSVGGMCVFVEQNVAIIIILFVQNNDYIHLHNCQ